MLLHAVLFEFKPEVSQERRAEVLALARRDLAAIPGVLDLTAGRAIRAGDEYPYAIAMRFRGREELEAYRACPAHARFRDVEFFPLLARKTTLDYED